MKIKSVVFLILLLIFSIIPSFFVFLDRWLKIPVKLGFLDDLWMKIKFSDSFIFPSYFIFIIFSILIVFILVYFISKKKNAGDILEENKIIKSNTKIKLLQNVNILPIIFVFLSEIGIFASIYSKGLSLFWILEVVILILFLSQILFVRKDLPSLADRKRYSIFTVLLIFLLVFAQIINLFNLCLLSIILQTVVFLFSLFLFFYLVNKAIFWILSLALTCETLFLDAWYFSFVGDEWAFFSFAKEILDKFDITKIFSLGVYEAHSYLSSFIQSIGLFIFGDNNFGWRFSSIIMSIGGIACLFVFFQQFVSKKIAIFSAILLAGSEYLISFSRIGYNSTQAFFAFSLVMMISGYLVKNKSKLSFVLLGLSYGFCFFVFPTAIISPIISLIFVVLFFKPFRLLITRILYLLIPFLLSCGGLIFQPYYWISRIGGTVFGKNMSFIDNISIIVANFFNSLFSFLYIGQSSHFVLVSYVDLVSGVFLIIGICYLIWQLKRSKLSVFMLISFLLTVIFVGVLHCYKLPPTTRMFMLLPFWAFFAAIGIAFFSNQLKLSGFSKKLVFSCLAILFVMVISLNLFQSYIFSVKNSADIYQSDYNVLTFKLIRNLSIYDNQIKYVILSTPVVNRIGNYDYLKVSLSAYQTNVNLDNIILLDIKDENIDFLNKQKIIVFDENLDDTNSFILKQNLNFDFVKDVNKNPRLKFWYSKDIPQEIILKSI